MRMIRKCRRKDKITGVRTSGHASLDNQCDQLLEHGICVGEASATFGQLKESKSPGVALEFKDSRSKP